jgi:hypothetical protein
MTSSGPPGKGWTEYRWRKFNKQLPSLLKRIQVPLFRGTTFPWIGGSHIKFKNKATIKDKIRKTFDAFDAKEVVPIRRIMSWTSSRKIANTFAKKFKGNKVVPGFALGDGYIHVIYPPTVGVDVYASLQKMKLISLGHSDELLVAKREKEFLLLPKMVLVPIKRRGRVFEWKLIYHP